ncbi:hypothetical protein [Actinokineospora sp. HUAS TT18]|uniref:hypothetical protein n=1 Tax=Actinokineospora sp. HUAS TT18 TaxID=3447451 RepID=UPI003F51E82E
MSTSTIDPRYSDLRDHGLAVMLSKEDIAEDAGSDPLERSTCRLHRRWLHHCVSSPQHVIAVTGHRWCRSCSRAVDIAVDELTGDVRLTCPRCRRTPDSAATRQLVRTCRASIAAAADTTAATDTHVVELPTVESLRRAPSRRFR